MNEDHDELRMLLGAFVLGGLDDSDHHAFSTHLRGCRECQREAAQLSGIPRLLDLADGSDPGADPMTDPRPATLPATVTVPAGESRELALLLNGRTPGDATLRVQVTRDGQPQRSLEATVAVDRGRHPIRRWGTGIARGDEYSVSLQVPSDACLLYTSPSPRD